jgi:hypothetical protein
LAFITYLTGCTVYNSVSRKTKNITRGFKGLDRNMKKLVGMTPFNNRTSFFDQNLETNFYETLIETIASLCPRVVILHSAAAGYPEFLDGIPQQGEGKIDNLELAINGRPFGLNAIVSITLNGINVFEEAKGFWWFKDTHYFFRIQMKAEMYDTETGTKLVDEIISQNIETEEFDIELFKTQNRLEPFLLEDAFEYFVNTIAEKVCDALIVQPWKGYIAALTGDKVILSSGENCGLEAGQVPEVFDSSEIIQGTQGHRFFMPRSKIGQIKITAVFDDSAEAEVIAGSRVGVGNLVKTKN